MEVGSQGYGGGDGWLVDRSAQVQRRPVTTSRPRRGEHGGGRGGHTFPWTTACSPHTMTLPGAETMKAGAIGLECLRSILGRWTS